MTGLIYKQFFYYATKPKSYDESYIIILINNVVTGLLKTKKNGVLKTATRGALVNDVQSTFPNKLEFRDKVSSKMWLLCSIVVWRFLSRNTYCSNLNSPGHLKPLIESFDT